MDILIPLAHERVNFLHECGFPYIELPHLFLPHLPTSVQRVWIYEQTPIKSITYMLEIDQDGIPMAFYEINQPCDYQRMITKYQYRPRYVPVIPPLWLIHDYAQKIRQLW